MLLFLDNDLAQDFTQGELTHAIGLANSLAIILQSHSLVFQIELQHLLGVTGGLDFFGPNLRPAAEIIDLACDFESMRELLPRVSFQFFRDIRVRSTFERLTID